MQSKKLLVAAIVGAIVVEFLVSWLMPKAILWYFDPPVQMGCSCREALEWAFHKIRVFQLYAVVVGAITGIAVSLYFRARKNATGELQPPRAR